MSASAPGARGLARAAWPGLAIALLAGWIYAPALRGSWLWDDGLEIVRNPQLADPAGWWKAWVAPRGLDYLPLKDSLLWLESRCWGDSVLGYHVVSLVLHVLSALLLWRLLGKLGVRHGWIGGLLLVAHPVAVESVAWISEFKNTLALPPLLLATLAFIAFQETGRIRAYGGALAWFVASLLCKSSGVMLPAGLLLLTWWRRGRVTRRDLQALVPFFAVSLGLGLVAVVFQQHRAIGMAGVMPDFSARLSQAGWSAAAYWQTAVFPVGLMPIYPALHPPLPAWLPWLAVAACFWWCWVKRSGWGRSAALGLGWFYLHLLPVLGLVALAYLRVAPRADHLAYLPLTGIVGLAAAALSAALAAGRRASGRVFAGTCVFALVTAGAVASRAYARTFQSEAALWTCAFERNPNSWLAANNLGQVRLEAGEPQPAAVLFETAVRLGPPSAEVLTNLGNAYLQLGRVAEARDQYERAVQVDPNFAGARYDLGRAWLQTGEPARARDAFQAALRLDPGYVSAHNNLGLALARLGELPAAAAEFEAALQLDPQLPEARLNLGNLYFRQGQIPAAIDQYRRALALNPRYAAAHQNLGLALERLGLETEARAEFSAARGATP